MLKKTYLAITTFYFLLLFSFPSYAHWADMSVIELSITNQKASAEITLPTPFLDSIDINKDKTLSNKEIIDSENTIKALFKDSFYLKADNELGELKITPSEVNNLNIPGMSKNTHTILHLDFSWNKPVKNYMLHYNLFPKEAVNAHCLVNANINDEVKTVVLSPSNIETRLNDLSTIESIKEFFLLGIEHIITGYDHILFLIALLLAGGGLKYLFKIVTAFTIAHSITLSLAVLDLVTISPKLIESSIALSIIYVATENFWRKKNEAHWALVFAFGLIHGLGFANILKEMNISKNQLVQALISFNIGLECGQIFIVVFTWLLLNKIINLKESLPKKVKFAGSFIIILVASKWFIERAFLE